MQQEESTPSSGEMKAAQWYSKIRASGWFLGGLVVFIGVWVGAHFLWGTDPEFGGLNTILSSEASIAFALFAIIAALQDQHYRSLMERLNKQADQHRVQLGYLLDIASALHDTLEAVADRLEEGDRDSDQTG